MTIAVLHQSGSLADHPDAVGNKELVDLLELRREQTVKGILKSNFITLPASALSHAREQWPSTPRWRALRSRRASGRWPPNRHANRGPQVRSTCVPSSMTIGAVSHLSMYSTAQGHVTCFRTAFRRSAWSM